MTKPDTKIDRRHDTAAESSSAEAEVEILDPNDTNLVRDRIHGQTQEHAQPPRLEDEGQSGG
jgi:hypothetical protein